MLKVYGSPMCPDCRNCKINVDKLEPHTHLFICE